MTITDYSAAHCDYFDDNSRRGLGATPDDINLEYKKADLIEIEDQAKVLIMLLKSAASRSTHVCHLIRENAMTKANFQSHDHEDTSQAQRGG